MLRETRHSMEKTSPSFTASRRTVEDIVRRYAYLRKLEPAPRLADIIGQSITRLAGDNVTLDHTQNLLVEMKRRHFITGQKFVAMMSRHLAEKVHIPEA